jgi:GNAT superfamily N-acetyltransferase
MMKTITVHPVHRDAAAQARVIATLTLAFVRDPVMRWFYPDAHAYLSHFPAFARAFGGEAFSAGTAWTSEDDGGAALWLPSGVHADGDAIASHLFSTIPESRHEMLGEVFAQMAACHPEEAHWYLSIIGVDAAHQGKGLGARLLEVALERCDEEGLIAYLESSNPANIPLYERHGFEVVSEIRGGDAPPLYPMLRPSVGDSAGTRTPAS